MPIKEKLSAFAANAIGIGAILFLSAGIAWATESQWIRLSKDPIVPETLVIRGKHATCQQFMRDNRLENPRCIDDLQFWFDASDAATLTMSGSTQVSEWRDKSGNNRHLSNTGAGLSPTLTSNCQAGRSCLRFVDDRMRNLNVSGISNTRHTAFFVFSWVSAAGQSVFTLGPDASNFYGFAFISAVPALRPRIHSRVAGVNVVSANSTTPDLFDAAFHLARLDGGTSVATITSEGTSGSDSTGVAYPTFSEITTGSPDITTGRYQFAEIVFYDRALSTAEITRIENYLKAKWNVL